MLKKTKKFLVISFSFLLILCMIIFLWLGSSISEKSKDTINDIGRIYMSEMSRQLQQKFDAITAQRLSQVQGLIRRTPPEEAVYGKDMLDDLALSASVREFSYMGLYRVTGENETIYGDEIDAFNEEEFMETLKDSSRQITSGLDKDGERLLLLTVNASYPMKDGKYSDVVVVGIYGYV